MDSLEKLEHSSLPPHEAFYSTLTNKNISKEDYSSIRRTFRTYSYSNEVGHFVSCPEYVVTSDIFCRDTSWLDRRYIVTWSDGKFRDLIGDTSWRDRQNIDGIIVIDNKMQREIIFVVEFENEKLWDW